MKLGKLVAVMALATATIMPMVKIDNVQASSTINDLAKNDSYGGVTNLEDMLKQEGVKYNSFTAENQNSYRNGSPEGVVIHETATPNATAHDEAIYFNREWKNISTYVHAFVDKTGVIQMMSPDYSTWGAGPVANDRFIQVELCEEDNQTDFVKSVNNDAIYVAQLLHHYNLTPDNASNDGQGTIWSHHAVTKFLGGTDHTDPDGYFAKWGYSMDDFCDLVTYYYDSPSSVKDAPATDNSAALPDPIATKTLMHDALVYDQTGQLTDATSKSAGTKLTIYSKQKIAGKNYLQIGSNQYIVASNVTGKKRHLKHNAYVYDNNGKRTANKKFRGKSIRTFGACVKIKGHKYYQIDINQFIKKGNF
ncbi:SLAP domain-containing protein [Lactobacillus sp. ESL0785]|uniref:SLAP domain-containing protein n=1 Tax=Lactobacillus sp. ESL0785 TaxID=2983232 RepID=UPI0023F89997|nr:SLAP domain-containing protein [Lactobacillus sp. ESL0785]WEV71628.1 SLAP domain-containing protein [Lactobacillus sp. ESL0785]